MKDGKSSSIAVAAAVMLSVAGVGLCAVLLQHHVVIKLGGNPLLSGACRVTVNADCDEVLGSEWATVGGLPTAMWGLFFFAAIGSWFLVIGRPRWERRWLHLVPLAATAAGIVFAAWLAYFMYIQLPKWCPLCATTHLLAGVLFVLAILLWPRRSVELTGSEDVGHGSAAGDATGAPLLISILTAVLIAGATSAFAWSEFNRRLERASAEEFKARWQEYDNDWQAVYYKFTGQPRVEIPLEPDDSVRGGTDAPHTIVVFEDLQCEHCREANKLLREKQEKYPRSFRVVVKHFPMNKKCNNHVMGEAHVAACAAAVTAEAARAIGGEPAFWKIHDRLFDQQAHFARQNKQFMQELAQDLGVAVDDVWKRIHTRSIWERVSRHVEQGYAVGVKATPAVFLDGRPVAGWRNSTFWDFIARQDRAAEKLKSPGQGTPATAPVQTSPQ